MTPWRRFDGLEKTIIRPEMREVRLSDGNGGGVLGMPGILAVTCFPHMHRSRDPVLDTFAESQHSKPVHMSRELERLEAVYGRFEGTDIWRGSAANGMGETVRVTQ